MQFLQQTTFWLIIPIVSRFQQPSVFAYLVNFEPILFDCFDHIFTKKELY
jgi:hypothetical protein